MISAGVYGESYALALPMVLLSLPATLKSLKYVPVSLLDALNITLDCTALAREVVSVALTRAVDKYQTMLYMTRCSHNERASICLMEDSIPFTIEEEIKQTAKKLVRKIIRNITRRLLAEEEEEEDEREEGDSRTSDDIGLLIEKTKRLRLESPDQLIAMSKLESEDINNEILPLEPAGIQSQSMPPGAAVDVNDDSSLALGKRRGRSQSHDAVALNDIKYHFGDPKSSLADLIADITKMSIMESQEEEEREGTEEESYTILDAITKPVEEIVSTYDVINSIPPDSHTIPPDSHTLPPDSHAIPPDAHTVPPNSHSIPNMDYYIIIHSYPPPGFCQKFLCDNTNEINLLFHFWLYKDLPFDPSISVTEQLYMGLFECDNVLPVHQDLSDGGISFHHLQERTVSIHSCYISPENAQVQCIDGSPFCSFYSAAVCGTRKVVTFHVIPLNQCEEDKITDSITNSTTLNELLLKLPNYIREKLHPILFL
jgi:hypothetical protein